MKTLAAIALAIIVLMALDRLNNQMTRKFSAPPGDCRTSERGLLSLGGAVSTMEEEIWKAVPGYEGKYEASSFGNIRSLDRLDRNGNRKVGRTLRPSVNSVGYRVVSLSNNITLLKRQLSRIVAQTFIPNPDGKKEVNHISGIKTDDRVANLEWVTPQENIRHARDTGLNKNFCETSPHALLTNEQVVEIRNSYIPHKITGNDLAVKYGISRKEVYDIVHRRRWQRLA